MSPSRCLMVSRREMLLSGVVGCVSGWRLFAASLPQSPAGSVLAPGRGVSDTLAYHEGRSAICLMGAESSRPERGHQAWFWDGQRWTSPDTNQGPAAREMAACVAHPGRKSVLLFGGIGLASGRRYGDLWELDASGRWIQHSAEGPGSLDHHAAAFDSARGRFVVYGGQDGTRAWNTAVWEWDGKAWHRIDTAGPGPRVHHAMTFDGRRGRVVLVGGFNEEGGNLAGVWEWDGRAWQEFAVDGPKPRARHRLSYDVERGVTVLFGGDAGNPAPGKFEVMDETWLWNGTSWRRATPAASPPAVMSAPLAYDPRRRRTVLQAGANTWEWDGSAWVHVFRAQGR